MAQEIREIQRFNQWWLWVILLGLMGIALKGLYTQLVLNIPFGDKPMSDTGLITFTLLVLALTLLFVVMKLVTEVNEEYFKIRFHPFFSKEFKWSSIKYASVVKYGFLGGWGIRYSSRFGTVYNIKGNKGVSFELHNGKMFLIGTQKAKEFEAMIKKLNKNGE